MIRFITAFTCTFFFIVSFTLPTLTFVFKFETKQTININLCEEEVEIVYSLDKHVKSDSETKSTNFINFKIYKVQANFYYFKKLYKMPEIDLAFLPPDIT